MPSSTVFSAAVEDARRTEYCAGAAAADVEARSETASTEYVVCAESAVLASGDACGSAVAAAVWAGSDSVSFFPASSGSCCSSAPSEEPEGDAGAEAAASALSLSPFPSDSVPADAFPEDASPSFETEACSFSWASTLVVDAFAPVSNVTAESAVTADAACPESEGSAARAGAAKARLDVMAAAMPMRIMSSCFGEYAICLGAYRIDTIQSDTDHVK